jgi:ribose 1,5-bisphosphokinase PhnN
MSTKPELPDAFIKMMKRSEINPDIVLMGIDEFAHKLDALDIEEARVIDSLEILRDQLTISAKENKKNLQARLSREAIISKIKKEKYLFLGIGVLFGTALSFLLFHLKRQKTKPN